MSKKNKKIEKEIKNLKLKRKEAEKFGKKLDACKNDKEMHKVLKKQLKKMGVKTPWEKAGYKSFDEMMKDPKAKIVIG